MTPIYETIDDVARVTKPPPLNDPSTVWSWMVACGDDFRPPCECENCRSADPERVAIREVLRG